MEFPGGKIEAGEAKEAALVREIHEELATTIKVKEHFCTVDYDYPNFHLHMDCYLCSVVDGNLSLLEHEAAKWLGRDDLETVAWLEADLSIIEKLKEYLAK